MTAIAAFRAWRIKRMLFAIVALVVTLGAYGLESAKRHPASYGVHGMALFGGNDALFASHLPMFHAPHNQQVILQIEIIDPVIRRSVGMELERKAELWTLNPEPFALSALWQKDSPLREFNAEIFHGHFERGGNSRFQRVKIRVVRVAFHAQLSAKPKAGVGFETYQVVQVGTSNFLFKHINARPDFDHIVKIAGALSTGTLRVATTLEMASREAMLQNALKTKFLRSIYLDDADLK